MNPSAHVTATEPLVHFQGQLASFRAEAMQALLEAEMEIQRAEGFIDDQLKSWQAYVRKSEDLVFQAKLELARRKMMRITDRPPDCTEQEKALRKAQARLEFAEEKLAATQRWRREWPEAVREYLGPARQLTSILEMDLPKMQAFLNQRIAALEAYAQASAPPPT